MRQLWANSAGQSVRYLGLPLVLHLKVSSKFRGCRIQFTNKITEHSPKPPISPLNIATLGVENATWY